MINPYARLGATIIAFLVPVLSHAAEPTLRSHHSAKDIPLTADANASQWKQISPVVIESDYNGKPTPGHRMEVRSRWTDDHLYLLFVNHYQGLNLKPNPVTDADTPQLWNWDVSETFIGSDFSNIKRYKEFQVSPQGEWIDLDIDRGNQSTQAGAAWNSGYEVKARIDEGKKIWYGEMKIPFTAIDTRKPAAGNKLRIGLFRMEGILPNRILMSWQATDGKTFHMPEKFGTLELVK
jgi:hypothetical protein